MPLSRRCRSLCRRGPICSVPTAAAAALESSKAFAKTFMARHAVPTAALSDVDVAEDALAFRVRPSSGSRSW